MPTVKRYDQLQVRQQGFPAARVSTDAPIEEFGGGRANISEAVGGLAGTINKIAQDEKQKADDVVTTDFYAKAASVKNNLMYDPKSGAMTKQGKDAFGAVDQYGQQFDDEMVELEKELHNDDQRAMAAKIKDKFRLDLDNDLQKHVFTESKKFDDETTKSGMDASRSDAVMNYQTPGKVRENIELQKSIIANHGERNGMPTEQVKVLTEQAVSGTHTAVLDRMLANGQDLEAKGYYDKVKSELSGKDVANVEKAIEEGSTRGESQRLSDAIYLKNPGAMSSAIDEARKIESPKVRDATVDRLKDRFALEKIERRDYEENLHKNAGNIIDKTGSIDNIPPAEWAQFSVADKAQLKAYAKTRLEGDEPKTNWEKYYDLRGLASSPASRNEFTQVNLMKYRNDLSNTEFKQLTDIQSDLRKGKADDKTLDGYRTESEIVNTALNEIGIDPSPKSGTNDAKKVSEFRREVERQQLAIQTNTGKKATNEQIQGITDNLIVKGNVPGSGYFGFFKKEKRVFEVQPGEALDIDVKEIPRAERSKVENALRAKKLPVTDQSIRDLYIRTRQRTTRGVQ